MTWLMQKWREAKSKHHQRDEKSISKVAWNQFWGPEPKMGVDCRQGYQNLDVGEFWFFFLKLFILHFVRPWYNYKIAPVPSMFQNQTVDNFHNFCPWFSLSFLFTSNNKDKGKLLISGRY